MRLQLCRIGLYDRFFFAPRTGLSGSGASTRSIDVNRPDVKV
jgi:hypothetical protein